MIKIFAPATMANIGPGFDVLGMAVDKLGDTIVAQKSDSGVRISAIESDDDLPMEADKNTAGIAAQKILDMLGNPGGINMKIIKGLPSGSGLGSSAASAVAGAVAANKLYGNKLTNDELIIPITEAEAVVSGGFFADNTAPCLYGGAVFTKSIDPLKVMPLGTIDELKVVLVTPAISILTKDARDVLPEKIPMKDVVNNLRCVASITAAFSTNNYDLLNGTINCKCVEPYRSKLIQGYDGARQAAIDAGADGFGISGAGPTVFAITNNVTKAEQIEKSIKHAFTLEEINTSSIITGVNPKGAHIVK